MQGAIAERRGERRENQMIATEGTENTEAIKVIPAWAGIQFRPV